MDWEIADTHEFHAMLRELQELALKAERDTIGVAEREDLAMIRFYAGRAAGIRLAISKLESFRRKRAN